MLNAWKTNTGIGDNCSADCQKSKSEYPVWLQKTSRKILPTLEPRFTVQFFSRTCTNMTFSHEEETSPESSIQRSASEF